MEMENNTYVVSMNHEVATRVTRNNGKHFNYLGKSSDVSYFTIPSSELFNLTSELKEGEGINAELATRENLEAITKAIN